MFSPEERQVYQYMYQGSVLYADPIALLRALKIETQGRFNALVEQANALNPPPDVEGWTPPPPESPEHLMALLARGELAAATIRAFGLPPFDSMSGMGTLEEEAHALLADFLMWQHKKKASGGTSSS